MKDSFDKAIEATVKLTAKQLTSDTYNDMKKAIMNNPDIVLADYNEKVKEAGKLLKELRDTLYFTEEYKTIMDKDLRESVLAYGNMLQATKNIFGEENITENVMVAAIQAASYTAYRNVMGPAAKSIKTY